MTETKNCRTCKKDVPLDQFAKNPGRQSLRLDCNPCRSANGYAKVLEKRKQGRTYIARDKRGLSDEKHVSNYTTKYY